MQNTKTLAAAGVLVLAGGLSACGSGSSSGSAGSGSGLPTNASKDTFCSAFNQLGPGTTPQTAADRLSHVGTPDGIDSGARHGFEVLIDRLRQLPDKANEGDITQMARGLTGQDQADVTAFVTYYARECQNFPTDSSS
jgi:hypothetical protein